MPDAVLDGCHKIDLSKPLEAESKLGCAPVVPSELCSTYKLPPPLVVPVVRIQYPGTRFFGHLFNFSFKLDLACGARPRRRVSTSLSALPIPTDPPLSSGSRSRRGARTHPGRARASCRRPGAWSAPRTRCAARVSGQPDCGSGGDGLGRDGSWHDASGCDGSDAMTLGGDASGAMEQRELA